MTKRLTDENWAQANEMLAAMTEADWRQVAEDLDREDRRNTSIPVILSLSCLLIGYGIMALGIKGDLARWIMTICCLVGWGIGAPLLMGSLFLGIGALFAWWESRP